MTTEHRNRPRTNLRAVLFLLSANGLELVETQTENVSMSGFFCYSKHLFAPGEQIRFLMKLSAGRELPAAIPMCLEGCAEVIRVTVGGSSAPFALGCHVESYRVLSNPDLSSSGTVSELLKQPYTSEKSSPIGEIFHTLSKGKIDRRTFLHDGVGSFEI